MPKLTIEDRDRGRWVFHGDEGGPPSGHGGADGSSSRVVLLAGGSPPSEARLRGERARADRLVCADGGTGAAWAAGLEPDLVAGDLDSLPAGALERLPQNAIHRDTGADDNDLEKAVREIYRRWGESVELAVLGAGEREGRTDHALANLGILVTEPHRRIQWVDGAGRMVALRSGRLTVEDAVGVTLSILPWSLHGAVMSAAGVRYPLDQERLLLGGRGISNQVAGGAAVVEAHEGVALVWVGV
jgi:thiamine pyrophosphokinase